MKKLMRLLPALLAVLALAACGGEEEKQTQFQPGETVSTYWFDFAVTGVETADRFAGYEAGEGETLVLCSLSISVTADEPVPMGWDDFLLRWSGEADASALEAAAPLPQASKEQFPDEFDLDGWEERTGLLVYRIPSEVDRAALAFQERYDEGESESRYSEGDLYQVWFDLK